MKILEPGHKYALHRLDGTGFETLDFVNAERLLHAVLKRLHIPFKAHFPLLQRYVADVFIPKYNLVLEADGWHHTTPQGIEHDRLRDELITQSGLTVIRFANVVIESDPVGTVWKVLRRCRKF
jgi:very-short-patch-repair endonuclease